MSSRFGLSTSTSCEPEQADAHPLLAFSAPEVPLKAMKMNGERFVLGGRCRDAAGSILQHGSCGRFSYRGQRNIRNSHRLQPGTNLAGTEREPAGKTQTSPSPSQAPVTLLASLGDTGCLDDKIKLDLYEKPVFTENAHFHCTPPPNLKTLNSIKSSSVL